MSSDLSFEQVSRVLKGRMAKSALLHIDKVDVRIGTALESAGLFARAGEESFPTELISIVRNPDHPARSKTAEGPVLFYRSSDSDRRQFALEVKSLLFSPTVDTRRAALAHFQRMVTIPGRQCVTNRTKKVLDDRADDCLSEDAIRWRSAALSIYDAIEDDLLLQLRGVNQSIRERYEDGMRTYLPQVLKPTVPGLEALELEFPKPSEQRDQIEKAIRELLAREAPLGEACDRYIETLGAMPLAGKLSFVHFVDGLAARACSPQDLCLELWAWAANSPMRKFYACAYILGSATQLSPAFAAEIVGEVIAILDLDDTEDGSSGASTTCRYWRTLNNLGQHFEQYLETLAPGGNGEAIAASAWWLARELVGILIDLPSAIDHLSKVAFEPVETDSQLAWRIGNPRISRSPAALSTHWAPWQFALLACLNEPSLPGLSSAAAGMEGGSARLHSLLLRRLTFWSPTSGPETNPVYLFELDVAAKGRLWAQLLLGDEQRKSLLEVVHLYSRLMNTDTFLTEFEKIAQLNEVEQMLAANVARLLGLRDELPLDSIWDKLTDTKWRTGTFRKLSTSALEMLFQAFSSALSKGGDRWRAGLPHIYAQACQENRESKDKVELFFMFTLMSCIHSSSMSGLERLLLGDMRPELLPIAKDWTARLATLGRSGPPWISARVRAASAAVSAAV